MRQLGPPAALADTAFATRQVAVTTTGTAMRGRSLRGRELTMMPPAAIHIRISKLNMYSH
jgi:hypothetical protein